MKQFFPLLLAATLFVGCHKKEKESETADPSATISLTNPVAGDTITSDTFNIMGSITANTEMHGYSVEITNLSDTTQVFSQVVYDHAKNYVIDMPVIPAGIIDTVPFRLFIEAIIDHHGHSATKEVLFNYAP